MMPKYVERLSDHIMLQVNEIDHIHGFGPVRSKFVVI
jgi:hypothetical protein